MTLRDLINISKDSLDLEIEMFDIKSDSKIDLDEAYIIRKDKGNTDKPESLIILINCEEEEG